MRARDFFKERKEWSERKIKILRIYLEDFCKILGGTRLRHPVYYIDGFAGPGVYDDGSKGSPLAAAELAQSLSESPRGYEVRCVNVELNHDLYCNLCDYTKDYPSWMVTNFEGPFAEYIPEILERIGEAPVLFFLDPIGIKDLRWSRLEPIYTRQASTNNPTEVLIAFNTRTAKRLAGSMGSSSKGAEARVARLSAVMGSDGWTTRWASARDREQRTEVLVDAYLEQLVSPQHFAFACSYPIRTAPQEELKYHLIFATAHYKGIDVMNDVLCKVEEEFQHVLATTRTPPAQPPLQGLLEAITAEERATKLSKVKHDIIDLVRTQGSLALSQVRLSLYRRWFGQISTSHFRQLCHELVKEGNLHSDTGDTLEGTSTISFRTGHTTPKL